MIAAIKLITALAVGLALVSQCCASVDFNPIDNLDLPQSTEFDDQFHQHVREAVVKLEIPDGELNSNNWVPVWKRIDQLIADKDEHSDVYAHFAIGGDVPPSNLADFNKVVKSIVAQSFAKPRNEFSTIGTNFLYRFLADKTSQLARWYGENYMKKQTEVLKVVGDFDRLFTEGLNVDLSEHNFDPASEQKLQHTNLAKDKVRVNSMIKHLQGDKYKRQSGRAALKPIEDFMDEKCGAINKDDQLKLVLELMNLDAIAHLSESLRNEHANRLNYYYRYCRAWGNAEKRNEILSNFEEYSQEKWNN